MSNIRGKEWLYSDYCPRLIRSKMAKKPMFVFNSRYTFRQTKSKRPPPKRQPKETDTKAPETGQTEEFKHIVEIFKSELLNDPPKLVISLIGDGVGFVPKAWPIYRLRKALIHTMETFIGGTWILHECQSTCRIKNIVMETLEEFRYIHEEYLKIEDAKGNSESSFTDLQNILCKKGDLSKLQEIISKFSISCFEQNTDIDLTMKLPVIMCVVEGDLQAINRIAEAVESNIPVVLIKGTGMASDLLHYCLNTFSDGKFTYSLTLRFDREELLTVQAPLQFGIYFNQKEWTNLERNIDRIKTRAWMVSVFDVEHDDPEKLASVAIDIILRKWALFKIKAEVRIQETDNSEANDSKDCSKSVAQYAVSRRLDEHGKKEASSVPTPKTARASCYITCFSSCCIGKSNSQNGDTSGTASTSSSWSCFRRCCKGQSKSQKDDESNTLNCICCFGKSNSKRQDASITEGSSNSSSRCARKPEFIKPNKKHISTISPLEFYLVYQTLQDPSHTVKQAEIQDRMYDILMNNALVASNHEIVAVLLERRDINKFNIQFKTLYEKSDEILKSMLKVERWGESKTKCLKVIRFLCPCGNKLGKDETQNRQVKKSGKVDFKCNTVSTSNMVTESGEIKNNQATKPSEGENNQVSTSSTETKLSGENNQYATRAEERARNLLRYTKPLSSEDLDQEPKDNVREQRFLRLLLWTVLTNKKELAELMWKKSPHPIMTALIASALLRKMSRKMFYTNYSALSEDLASHSKTFCQRAMDVADGVYKKDPNSAIKSLKDCKANLWGISSNCTDFAQEHRIYDFVSHYVAQKSYNSLWYGNSMKDTAKSILFVRISDKGENCCTYIKGIVKAPVILFCLYYAFFLGFLVSISGFVLSNLDVGITDFPRCLYEIFTYVWIVGDCIEEYAPALLNCCHVCSKNSTGSCPRCGQKESCECSNCKLICWFLYANYRAIRVHLGDFWNALDASSYLIMLIAVAYRYTHEHDERHNETTRLLYTVTMYIMYMRFLHVLLINRNIGPAIIMLKEALKDLLRFLIVLGVFIVSTGVFYHANLYPNHYDLFSSFGISYWSAWRIIYLPFWAIFGEFKEELDGVGDSGCSFNESIYVYNANVERCPEKNWWVSVMSGIYTILANLLLVNLVIAMFSYLLCTLHSFRFEKIKENSKKYWLYHRSTVILEFNNRVPSPFNILCWIVKIFKKCYKCYKKKCKCKGDPKVNPEKENKKRHGLTQIKTMEMIIARQLENHYT